MHASESRCIELCMLTLCSVITSGRNKYIFDVCVTVRH